MGDSSLKTFAGGKTSTDGGKKCQAGIELPVVPRKMVCDLAMANEFGSGIIVVLGTKIQKKK